MRHEKMQLTLMPSKVMDRWAKKNKDENNKIRLSKRARAHYRPSDWDSTKVSVYGRAAEAKLVLSQAPLEEVKRLGTKNVKGIGFVTTKTYNLLMGKVDDTQKAIWVSEDAQTITIGCDPEFVLVEDSGKLKYADHVFNSEKYNSFGSDGPCAELRPAPSQNTKELVKNIKNLLNENAQKIEQYKWLGGASYSHFSENRTYYIGGHIHFGLPSGKEFSDQLIQARVARILDELIAVPLVRIDTPLPSKRRTVSCHGTGKVYGAFGDIIGGEYKFEWRVPSGFWLVHPDIAQCVLSASKAVVEEVWRRFEDKNRNKDFMLEVHGKNNLQHSFKCVDSEEIREVINNSKPSDVPVLAVRKIHERLKGMATYVKYKEEIDEFINICCSKTMPLPNHRLELRYGWVNNKPL